MNIPCSDWDCYACISNAGKLKGYEFRQNSKTQFLKEKKKQPKPYKSEKKLTIYSLIYTSIFRAFHSISLFIHTKKRKQIFGETSWKTTPTPICHCIRRTLVCALNYSSKHCLVLVLILNSLKKTWSSIWFWNFNFVKLISNWLSLR